MLSQFDIDHVDEIINGHGDWFIAKLLRLIGDADQMNREAIRAGFPEVMGLWESWYYKDNSYLKV